MIQPLTMIARASLPLLTILVLSISCGHAGQDPAATGSAATIVRTMKEVTIFSGTPVTTADLRIEGMSCEMMCGGSIKKALAKLPGVSGTEIAFQEGDAADHAVVTYDETQVSDAELVEAVQALFDGQYTVKEVAVIRQVKAEGSASVSGGEGGAEKVGAYASPSVWPAVVAVLTRILRH